MKLGAYHTLDIEANKDVRIEKEAGGWDSIALGRVEESCVPGRGAEVAAIVCGEGASRHRLYHGWGTHKTVVMLGTAIFCLLSEHMTVVLQRLEVPIPRKISNQSSAHEKVRFVLLLPLHDLLTNYRDWRDSTKAYTPPSCDMFHTHRRPYAQL